MATEQAQRLAEYLVDFEEPDGIRPTLSQIIQDCASTGDARQALADFLDKVMEGKLRLESRRPGE